MHASAGWLDTEHEGKISERKSKNESKINVHSRFR